MQFGRHPRLRTEVLGVRLPSVAPIYAMAKRVQLAEFLTRGNHWHHILLCMYPVAHYRRSLK